MFCPKCGTRVPDGSSHCSNCGAALAGSSLKAGAVQIAQSSAVKGFFVLWGMWFTMPLKTLKLCARQLREFGQAGSLETSSDLPHLSWVRVAGGTIASIGIVIFIAIGVIKGLMSLGDFRYSAGRAFGGLIGYPIGGFFAAIVWDWFVMTWFVEMLGLWVGMANDIKKLASAR